MRTDVCGVWPNQSIAIKLLNAVSSPTRNAAHGKHASEQIQINADGVIGGRGIEIDIWVNTLGGDYFFHDLFDASTHFKQIQIASVGGDLLGECF